MSKNDEVRIEMLPSRDSILRSGIEEKTLNRLVQEKVAEIMADRDTIVFEPFFRSRQVAYELKRLQTVPERHKWSVYFERYGCLICETHERIHVGNGMCNRCYNRTRSTLKQIVAEGINGEPATPSRPAVTEVVPQSLQMILAKASGAVHRRWNKPRKRKATQ
jgi:hypothetical protein